jgi:DNA-binding NarL/FixJ family response regulator
MLIVKSSENRRYTSEREKTVNDHGGHPRTNNYPRMGVVADTAPRLQHEAMKHQRTRVAVANDYEIIVVGLEGLLRCYEDRLHVCERIIVGEPVSEPVDVALYDLYGREGVGAPALRTLVRDPDIHRVVVFSMDLTADLIADGTAAGATGFISKALTGEEMADALVRAAGGEDVVAATAVPKAAHPDLEWPGKKVGLTERESQAITLLAQGLSNREIASALYLSTETIKSYVAQIFAKLQVRNRVEATNFVHRTFEFSS